MKRDDMSKLPYGKKESRAWAREKMQGVCNVIIASYTKDLQDINEKAIRHDVQVNIQNKFAGFLVVSETNLTPDEYIRFTKISADEAKGKQLLVHHASFNSLEENISLTNRAAEAGAELSLLSYPANFYPTSEQDIYDYTRKYCDSVDMAVMLFPVPLWGFERIHPASLSLGLMEKLISDVPNIVAVKAEGGHPSIAGFAETWRHLHDKVVVTMPLENQGIPLATMLPMQVIATSNTEYFGSAVPKMLQLARDGKHDEAMKLFWQVDPARRANEKIATFGGSNSVHRMAWKYQAWLNGYNGGPLRMPTPRLVSDQMRMLRKGLVDALLPVTDDPDEAYFVGRN